MTLYEGLWQFLFSTRIREWLEVETPASPLRVYLRKALRVLDGKPRSTLDIANVTVELPRRGAFTDLLWAAEELAANAGLDAIYVESILEPALYDFLKRKGYSVALEGVDETHAGASLFKLIKRPRRGRLYGKLPPRHRFSTRF